MSTSSIIVKICKHHGPRTEDQLYTWKWRDKTFKRCHECILAKSRKYEASKPKEAKKTYRAQQWIKEKERLTKLRSSPEALAKRREYAKQLYQRKKALKTPKVAAHICKIHGPLSEEEIYLHQKTSEGRKPYFGCHHCKIERQHRYAANNKRKVLALSKRQNRARRDELKDHYIKKLLRNDLEYPEALITPEIIELKRLNLQLKRFVRSALDKRERDKERRREEARYRARLRHEQNLP